MSSTVFAGIKYHDDSQAFYSHIVPKRQSFPEGTPLEPAVKTTSKFGFATALLIRTDGSKIPYEDETAYIEITGDKFEPLFIEIKFFRAVTLIWATDRILVIKRDIGHIAGIEEVIDVVEHRWLLQKSITYIYQ